MLADEKSAGGKVWAGACPFLSVGAVCIVDWQGNLSPLQLSPFLLKVFPPGA